MNNIPPLTPRNEVNNRIGITITICIIGFLFACDWMMRLEQAGW